MHTDRGFYSIELISCLVVMGILMAVSVPQLSNLLKRRELRAEAEALQDTTELLIAQARQTITKTALIITKNRYEYTFLLSQTPRPTVHTFPSGIVSNKTDPFTINFYPSGVTSPATITLSQGTNTCTFTLSLRGRVTILC